MPDSPADQNLHLTSSHWGVGLAELSEGRLIAVRPHPDDPSPSRINENIPDGLAGSARVRRPAVRRGYLEHGPLARAGERGAEPFVEVSWDEALSLVAGELTRIRTAHGNEAIFAGSYGWASAGRFHHAQSQLKRFLNAAGGFVRSEGNYSYNAALVLLPHIVGSFRDHVKQATRWRVIAREGRLVVMFGGIPLRNAQVSGGGVGRHRLRREITACAEAGVEFVNVSPLCSDAAEALKAEWLPPRPGSDTAVMMGLAHTLLSEGLHDADFLARYTVGFGTVAAYLRGEIDGVAKDADWAAAQSGLPAERLRRLARHMAAGRTLICTAAGLQRADHGEQPLWMTVVLAAMLGQIGLPGGGFGIGYGADDSIGTMDRPLHWPAFPQGENPVEAFVPVAMLSEMLLNPGGTYDYNGQRRRFPDIRMVWWAGGNPFHHHQDLNRLRRAFQRPETIIVNEIGWTASARHADIVLPVAAPQERSDFGAGSQDNALIPMPKAVTPPGEARCEFEIFAELERRLALGSGFSRGLSAEAWQEEMWAEMRTRAAARGFDLPDWDAFLRGDILHFDDPAPDAVYLSDFRADPEAHPLATPSGRIELASETIAGFGYDDCPGHPTWLPPRDWGTAAAQDHPLHLLSGQPETRLHSQYDSGAFSMSRKIQGREPILINPQDAAGRGIADGDVVMVLNARGRCLAGAVVTEDIRPGSVFLWTGAWYDPDLSDPYHLDRHGNPNVLTHDLRTSRLSQGPAAQSAFVEVRRFEGRLPPVKAFDPPFAGDGT
ncbi:MAG: molybdopterin-dependent oxidoreductase [Kiloniellales bacterium]|nr:molybdopterin-dependent oxidoreductase [Kiloniellales bacterium]